MIRFLIQIVVFLASAAIGLLVAATFVDGVTVKAIGFITAVAIYSVIQAVISPFLMKMAARNAAAFLGGIGLLATFVALVAMVNAGLGLAGLSISALVFIFLTFLYVLTDTQTGEIDDLLVDVVPRDHRPSA